MLTANLLCRRIQLSRIGSTTSSCYTTVVHRTFTSTKNNNNNNISTTRQLNLALIGPPGSGKGSYGKYLSRFLDIPIVTVSDVLRRSHRHQEREKIAHQQHQKQSDDEDEENDGDDISSASLQQSSPSSS